VPGRDRRGGSHRTAPGNHTDADFPLAEKRVLARGEPQIAGEHELASRATGARPGIEAMLTTGARASRTRTSTQAGSPVGLSPESRALSDGLSPSYSCRTPKLLSSFATGRPPD